MNCFGDATDIDGGGSGAEPMEQQQHHSSAAANYVGGATDNLAAGSVAVGPQYTSVIVEATNFQMNNEYVH